MRLTTVAGVVTNCIFAGLLTYALVNMWETTYDNVVPRENNRAEYAEAAVEHANKEQHYYCNESRAVLRGKRYVDMCEEKTTVATKAASYLRQVPHINSLVNERNYITRQLVRMKASLPTYCNKTISEAVVICNATRKGIDESTKRVAFLDQQLEGVR